MKFGEWMRRLWYRLNRERFDRDLQREMEAHLRMMEDPKAFGNTLRLREETHDEWGWGWLDRLFQDVRYAMRGFFLNPAFTLAAIATVALGIGSTTAVFSAVDRILFRGLPYANESRLVSVGLMTSADSNEFLPGDDYWKWRTLQTPFEAMTAVAAVSGSSLTSGVNPGGNCDLSDGSPLRLNCTPVDSTLLSTLGVHPLLGRDFSDQDMTALPNVALVSYALWKDHFAGSPDVVGKSVAIDGRPTTIVGVLPESFELPTLGSADILEPLPMQSRAFIRAFGRLKPKWNIEQARQAMAPLFEDAHKYGLLGSMFGNRIHLEIRSLRDRQDQDSRAASYVLLAAVLLVLIIACINVANLLLARATARDREFAVRRALGAGRSRLVRQTLTEALLIGLTGGIAGLAVAAAALRVFVTLAPQGIPHLDQATLDFRVVLFAFVASIATGIAFGVTPGLYQPAGDMLRSRTGSVAHSGLRRLLIVGQIALSVVLLSGGVLLLRTLWNLERIPLGMNPDNVTVISMRLQRDRYGKPEQQFDFFEEFERRLKELPGIGSYALTDAVSPGGLGTMSYAYIHVEAQPDPAAGTAGVVGFRHVTPDYFSILGIPLLGGRFFDESDRGPEQASGGPTGMVVGHAVILSETLARRLFPTTNPIGKHVRWGDAKDWMTVVGVVGNVKNNPSLTGPDDPEWYFPRLHDKSSASLFATVLLRSPMGVGSASDSVRKLIAAMDPALPIAIEPLPQRLETLTARPRFTAALCGAFAAAALLLAAVGLSGILSVLVIQRTQEIGVRMALGASAKGVVRLIVGYALRWTLLGVGIGAILSFAASQAIRTLLYQVPAHDPWTLAFTTLVLLAVALGAAWLPSRRAARIDPMVALRHD